MRVVNYAASVGLPAWLIDWFAGAEFAARTENMAGKQPSANRFGPVPAKRIQSFASSRFSFTLSHLGGIRDLQCLRWSRWSPKSILKVAAVVQLGFVFVPGLYRRRLLEATCSTIASTYAPEPRYSASFLAQGGGECHMALRVAEMLLHRPTESNRQQLETRRR